MLDSIRHGRLTRHTGCWLPSAAPRVIHSAWKNGPWPDGKWNRNTAGVQGVHCIYCNSRTTTTSIQ
eukprot:1908755-Amphidinium_carterae.1